MAPTGEAFMGGGERPRGHGEARYYSHGTFINNADTPVSQASATRIQTAAMALLAACLVLFVVSSVASSGEAGRFFLSATDFEELDANGTGSNSTNASATAENGTSTNVTAPATTPVPTTTPPPTTTPAPTTTTPVATTPVPNKWPFPNYPLTDDEWEEWEQQNNVPPACVPKYDEETGPDGRVVRTYYADCSEYAESNGMMLSSIKQDPNAFLFKLKPPVGDLAVLAAKAKAKKEKEPAQAHKGAGAEKKKMEEEIKQLQNKVKEAKKSLSREESKLGSLVKNGKKLKSLSVTPEASAPAQKKGDDSVASRILKMLGNKWP
eukprot:CAMPEP_0181335582 /NCGR_PEP_ID=MMETSP1101-20121128/26918_1 /TAXON_ID=46948 /ORGANISM="Rhodomonas abbreviata, Strain Caron Lab Isolate" /LENGTH=321 /DNA_ID=CAMNT_0023445731 /DNA_START=1 /DNA_END=966 /DNA_ORIENTATION=-